MKKTIALFCVISLAVAGMLAFTQNGILIHSTNAETVMPGFAVVELFTSEGCSSCPPADALLAKIAKEYPDNVFVLEFHVDYWDRLGWKDIFSSADYTQRQQEYAALFGLNSIYTPQAVINGKTECTGSDEDKLRIALHEALNSKAGIAIEAAAKANDGKKIKISYNVKEGEGKLLNIALVQLHGMSDVKKGENEGLRLQHINIVRAFKTVSLDAANGVSGSISLAVPSGLTAKDCMVISFLQEKNFHITGSVSVSVQ